MCCCILARCLYPCARHVSWMALLIGAVDADRRPNGERRMVNDEWWLMANGGNIEPRRWWAVAIRSVRENLCALFALFTVRVAPQSRASCKIRFGRLSLTILLTCPSASKLLWKWLFSRLAYCRSLFTWRRGAMRIITFVFKFATNWMSFIVLLVLGTFYGTVNVYELSRVIYRLT